MQNITNKYFLSLSRSAIRGEAVQNAPQGVDFDKLLWLAYHHGMVEILSYVIPKIEPKIEGEIAKTFERLRRTGIAKEINQEIELGALCDAFSKNGIDYMLLKGSVLKKHYPTPDMRSMCDIDMLIKKSQVKQADKIMTELGYIDKLTSDHDISYKKPPYINIELHYNMTQYDFGKRAFEYYKNIWSMAKQIGDTHAHELSPEDFYVHHIEHMSKHYALGGCGVRPFCDIFVFLNAHPSIDFDYISKALDEICLKDFEAHVRALALKWFGDGEGDEVSEAMEGYILTGGAYGTVERGDISLIVRKGTKKKKVSKLKLLLYKAFLPYRHMKVVYPSLKKAPYLLPFYWIYRIICVLLFRRKKIKSNLKVNEKEAQINALSTHFTTVGLTEF